VGSIAAASSTFSVFWRRVPKLSARGQPLIEISLGLVQPIHERRWLVVAFAPEIVEQRPDQFAPAPTSRAKLGTKQEVSMSKQLRLTIYKDAKSLAILDADLGSDPTPIDNQCLLCAPAAISIDRRHSATRR
jgi:hypothetical protein